MLTEREKWLMSKAFDMGWKRRFLHMKSWLIDSAADCVNVEMVLAKEAPLNNTITMTVKINAEEVTAVLKETQDRVENCFKKFEQENKLLKDSLTLANMFVTRPEIKESINKLLKEVKE